MQFHGLGGKAKTGGMILTIVVAMSFLVGVFGNDARASTSTLVPSGVVGQYLGPDIYFTQLPLITVVHTTHGTVEHGAPTYATDYERRLRQHVLTMLDQVVSRCTLESTSHALNHTKQIIQGKSVLEVTDARCLTDGLSLRDDGASLLANKLQAIKILARAHAGGDEAITKAMRTLPKSSRFTDIDLSARWSTYVLYSEYHGLLDRVENDQLAVLQPLSPQEKRNLFGMSSFFMLESMTIEMMVEYRLRTDTQRESLMVLGGDNWKIIQWLLDEFEGTTNDVQRDIMVKLWNTMHITPDPLTDPLKEFLGVMLWGGE